MPDIGLFASLTSIRKIHERGLTFAAEPRKDLAMAMKRVKGSDRLFKSPVLEALTKTHNAKIIETLAD